VIKTAVFVASKQLKNVGWMYYILITAVTILYDFTAMRCTSSAYFLSLLVITYLAYNVPTFWSPEIRCIEVLLCRFLSFHESVHCQVTVANISDVYLPSQVSADQSCFEMCCQRCIGSVGEHKYVTTDPSSCLHHIISSL